MFNATKRKSSLVCVGFLVGFAPGYAGWHLWTGEWAIYDAGAFMGYSILGAGGGFGVGYAVGLVLKRVGAQRGGNRAC